MTAACIKCGFIPGVVPTATWTFTVGRPVRSLNEHRVNAGSTRHAYGRERKAWEADMVAIRRVLGIPLAIRNRRVTLTRVMGRGQREFDRDNLHGGCKVIVDAMVRAGLLMGDDRKGAQVFYEQVRCKVGGGSTLNVLLEEMP